MRFIVVDIVVVVVVVVVGWILFYIIILYVGVGYRDNISNYTPTQTFKSQLIVIQTYHPPATYK